MPRKTHQVETRLVVEYLHSVYPNNRYVTMQPLGGVDPAVLARDGYKKGLGINRPFRPEADAIVFLPGALILVEAKVWSIVNGLAKLPLYKSLVPFTPELKDYSELPIMMELVVGWTNPNLEIMARGMDVAVKVYSPAWLQETINGMQKYWTAEYRRAREEKLALQQYYGVD